MTLFDTHCHLNFEAYDADRADVVARAADAGVTRILNPGIDLPTSRAAVEMAARFERVYAAVGVHPNSSAGFAPALLDELRTLAAAPGVVAIGEIGLDYYWDRSPRERQVAAFEQQLALAAALELPVIIHNRDASEDVLAVLETWVPTLPPALKARPGVLHSFSAPLSIAERALAAGFYLGFTGPITFKKADDVRAAARLAPLDRVLVETDGPFLTPVPFRGQRNEPAYIPYIVQALAQTKDLPETTAAAALLGNARRLFGIND
jgi:TatD DNase family protein